MTDSNLPELLKTEAGTTRKWKVFIYLGLALVLVVAFLWWRKAADADRNRVDYVTDTVTKGDVQVDVLATGSLKPSNEVTVGSEISGTATEVLVDTNDQVAKGQVLARLDTSTLEQEKASNAAAVESAKASVAQAQADLTENRATLKRLQKLKETSGGRLPSQADMDAAVAAVAKSEADMKSAEASVSKAEADMNTVETDITKSTIKSPLDGIVLTRDIDPGQTVAASMEAPELFVIADKLENLKLEVDVAEVDIAKVKKGQSASFTVDAWPERSFDATVKKAEYGSQTTDNVVTYTTELTVSNDDLSLRPGMSATAQIHVAEAKGVLRVRNAALKFDPAAQNGKPAANAEKKSFLQSIVPGPPRRSSRKAPEQSEDAEPAVPASGEAPHIWVLRNGTPEKLRVTTGLTDGKFTEIAGEGVSEGLQVILHASSSNP